jgi:hypothetical protein
LIAGVIAFSGCTTTTTNNTNSTYSSDQSNSASNTFENKFVSFTKPNGNLKIEDQSTDNKVDVMFYDGDKLIGQIVSATTTDENIEGMITLSNGNTTIAGQNAATYSDSAAVGAYIFIPDNSNGEKMIIHIDFDPSFSTAFNTIKDSLVIKQYPNE